MAWIKKSISEAIKDGFNVDVRNVNECIELQKEVAKFYPCEVMLMFNHYDNKEHFEHSIVQLKNDLCSISINKNWDGKKYRIGTNDDQHLNNISGYVRSNIRDSFEAPNNIGVLSNKKIQQWIDYINQYVTEIRNKDKENSDKIALFLESIKDEPVKWYAENKRGAIIKNGLRYEFNIDNGNIDEKISLEYFGGQNLELFKQLSDNKYKGAK